jgi:hypothetical protein
MKSSKSGLCRLQNALYFYIINNGSTVSGGEKEGYHEAERFTTTKIFTFFSYGKQSLEVGCFYRGPFFFYTPIHSFLESICTRSCQCMMFFVHINLASIG